LKAKLSNLWQGHQTVLIWLTIGIIGIALIGFLTKQTINNNDINNRITVENPCAPRSEKDVTPRNIKKCRQFAATVYKFFPKKVKRDIKLASPAQIRKVFNRQIRANQRRNQKRAAKNQLRSRPPISGGSPSTPSSGGGSNGGPSSPPPQPPSNPSRPSIGTPPVSVPPVGPLPGVNIPQPHICTMIVGVNCP
jgi:hypothetical protein